MKPEARTRLASIAVLFLVLVTGFLLGMAWDRTDGMLAAGGSTDDAASLNARDDIGAQGPGRRGEELSDRDDNEGVEADREDAEEEGRERRRRRLIAHRVDLTPEQEDLVDSIGAVHWDRVRELRRRMEQEYDRRAHQLRREMEAAYDPRFEAVVMDTRRSIRAVLTREQASRYDSLLAEHDRREAEKEENKKERR